MNKLKKIAIIILIISTIINFIYSVEASGALVGTNNITNIKKTKVEIIELKQKVDNLKKNKEKLGDYSQTIINISKDLDNYLKDAENNSEKTTSIPDQNWNLITSLITVIEEKQNSGESFSSTQTSSEAGTNTTTVANDFGETYYIPKTLQKVNNGVFIAHASTNNSGRYKSAGDQTGKEVCIAPATDQKKIYKVYRYKGDIKINNTIAFLMGDMCNNENVGYNLDRPDPKLYEQMKSAGYDPTKVGLCATDCSNSIGTMIQVAFTLSNNGKTFDTGITTSKMGEKLLEAGFELISTSDNTVGEFAKSGILQVGDVLVSKAKGGQQYGHAVTFIGNYYTSGQIAPSTPGSVGSGGSNGYTAEGEEVDDRQNIDEKKFRFSGLPGDVTYEGEINPIRNFFKKIGDFIDYLLGLLFMIIKVIIIGFTNIIYNLFLTITSFMKK